MIYITKNLHGYNYFARYNGFMYKADTLAELFELINQDIK